MRILKNLTLAVLILALTVSIPPACTAWFDETHIAIAKAAGYQKWFNAAAPDVAKSKLGDREGDNHFVNNPKGAIITPEMVMSQVEKYDHNDPTGHLYGAILASVRAYIEATRKGKYGEYHLAYCAHYAGDLSQPLHSIVYDSYNKHNHTATDGVINDEILNKEDKIKVYPININSEEDLAREIAMIANISMVLGYKLEDEGRGAFKRGGLSTNQPQRLAVSGDIGVCERTNYFIEYLG